MEPRLLHKKTRIQIILGRLAPELNALRLSHEHGDFGELEVELEGFLIKWVGNKNKPDPKQLPLLPN